LSSVRVDPMRNESGRIENTRPDGGMYLPSVRVDPDAGGTYREPKQKKVGILRPFLFILCEAN